MQFDADGDISNSQDGIQMVTLCYDEKPGIQAIGNACRDCNPTPERAFARGDSEYASHGTLSWLVAIVFLTGKAILFVSEKHKSSDFVMFLKELDAHYAKQDKVRNIMDNHSAYTSKT